MNFSICTQFFSIKFSRIPAIPLSGHTITSRALISTYASTQNAYGGSERGEGNTAMAVPTSPSSKQEANQTVEEIPRLPRSVQAIYLRPLRREAEYGVPSCDLQMRSFSVRNLEFFADFALRAAYYLKLPAFGPVPLPRITERWTVPKSNFIFKKSQENFERITMRRLIQIRDGHPETVELWLAFLRKHAYYGVGMKASVWEYNELEFGKSMEINSVDSTGVLELFSRKKSRKTTEKALELINEAKFRLAAGENAPMMRP